MFQAYGLRLCFRLCLRLCRVLAELRAKYADSPVRAATLRHELQFTEYQGPRDMEQYISAVRSIEVQLSYREMAFGDRLQ